MKLTRRSEYALLALTYLGRNAGEEWIPLGRIAEGQAIPLRYLEHIVAAMCRAGYLVSSKGQHGGYRLARKPSEITLAEVIRLFDGALAPVESVSKYFYQATPIERETKMLAVLGGIRDYVARTLEGTTLAEIL